MKTAPLLILVALTSALVSCSDDGQAPSLPRLAECADAWTEVVSSLGTPEGTCREAWVHRGRVYVVGGGGRLASRSLDALKFDPFVTHHERVMSILPRNESLVMLQDDSKDGRRPTQLIVSTIAVDNPSERMGAVSFKPQAMVGEVDLQEFYAFGPALFRPDALFVGLRGSARYTFSRLDLTTKAETILVEFRTVERPDGVLPRYTGVQPASDRLLLIGRQPVLVDAAQADSSNLTAPSLAKATALAVSEDNRVLWWGLEERAGEKQAVFTTSAPTDKVFAGNHAAPFRPSAEPQAWPSINGGWLVVGEEEFEERNGTSLWHFDENLAAKRLGCVDRVGLRINNLQQDERGIFIVPRSDFACGVDFVAF